MTEYNEERTELSALTAAGAGVIIDSLGRVWRAWQHPRDHLGRFIQTFSSVKFRLKSGGTFDDVTGTVTSMDEDGSIWVKVMNVLSPDAKQRFNPGDTVRVPKSEIEVFDVRARIKEIGRGIQSMRKGETRRLRNTTIALNKLDPEIYPEVAEVSDLLVKVNNQNLALKKLKKAKVKDQARIDELGVEMSDNLEAAADLVDQMRGALRDPESGNQLVPGQANADETALDNAFQTLTQIQGQIEGAVKGRQIKGGMVQGRAQARGGKIDSDLPGEETGVNVYKDLDGNIVDDPVLTEREKIKAQRRANNEPELSDEEIYNQFIANDGLVEPRMVNGVDRFVGALRRGKDAVATRTMTDRNGKSVAPGSIVTVDAGSGRGGGKWKRPEFTGLLMRVHQDKKSSQKVAVIRDFDPRWKGVKKGSAEWKKIVAELPEEQRAAEEFRPDEYFKFGWGTYTRTTSGTFTDVSPTDYNYAQLMAEFVAEDSKALDKLSADMLAAGGGRRFSGADAGRMSEVARYGALESHLRRSMDGNGRILQVGDWVYSQKNDQYGQITYMEPNRGMLRVSLGNSAGESVRVSPRNTAFLSGANGAVFGRTDLDALSGAGRYAPTRDEAAAVARRLGLDDIADAIESGSTELPAVFSGNSRWTAIATEAMNTRGRLYDRGQRGLDISQTESRLLQDAAILGAAMDNTFREGEAIPEQKVEIPTEQQQISLPEIPSGLIPEGLDFPEGARIVLNPNDENAFFVENPDGTIDAFSIDPDTGDLIQDEEDLNLSESPNGPLDDGTDAPAGYERRMNGVGQFDTFFTPDGRFRIQPNDKGELAVVDISDVNNPQILDVVGDWEEVGSLIGEVSPDSVPSPDATGTPEEIYPIREEAARQRLSDTIGADASTMSREDIVQTPEFQEAAQDPNTYSQMQFDLNEVATAEAAKEQGNKVTAPPAAEEIPEPAPTADAAPESAEAPAAPSAPSAASDNPEQGMIDNLLNLVDKLYKDPRIPNKVAQNVDDLVARMENALDDGDTTDFFDAARKITQIQGVPEPTRNGLARALDDLERNGAADGTGEVRQDAFADQLQPLYFQPIGGDTEIGRDAETFLEEVFLNFGDILAARMKRDQERGTLPEGEKGDKQVPWSVEEAKRVNADRIGEVEKIRADLAKAMETEGLTDEQRTEGVDLALQRLELLLMRSADTLEGGTEGVSWTRQLIAGNKSGYSLYDRSVENLGGDAELADEVLSTPWGDRSGTEDGGYAILDFDGNPITEGFAAEFLGSRLAFDADNPLTQEQFDEWWENVPDVLVEGNEGDSVSVFLTTDDEGVTTISAGLWTDDEFAAAELAALNGDTYYDASDGSWSLPGDTSEIEGTPSAVEAAERDLNNAIYDYEKPLSREALDDQATEINALNDAIETVKNAETVEEIDALEAEYGGPDLGTDVDDTYAAYVAARRAEVSTSGSDEGWTAEVDGKPVAVVRVVRAENADEEDTWEVYLADEDSPNGYGTPLKDIDGFPYSETYEDAVARAEGVAETVRSNEAAPASEVAKPERKKKAPKSPISPAARSAISDNAESLGPDSDRRLRELLAGEYPQSEEDWDLLEQAVDSAMYQIDQLFDQGKERLEMDGIDMPTLRGQRTALRAAERKVASARAASDTDVPAPAPADLDEGDVPEPDTGRGVLPRFDDAMMDKALEKIDTTGGYSIDLSTGQDEFNEGYAVALPGRESDRYDLEDFNENAKTYTNYYITQYEKDLSEDGKVLGYWKDDEDRVVIDVSEMVDDLEEALQLGRDRNQDAIWDNKNKKEIPVPKDGAPSGPDTDPQAPGGGDDGGLPPSGGGDSGGGGTPDGGGRSGPDGGAGLSNEITAESIEGVEAVELSDQSESPGSPPKGPAPERFVAAGGTSLEDRSAKQEQYIGDGNISREVLLSDLTGNMTSEEWAETFGSAGTAEGLSSWLKLLEQPFSPYTVALDGNPNGNVGIARTLASTVLADIPIDTDVPEQQEMREAARQTILGIDGLQGAEKVSPLNEAEKATLLEARAEYAAALSDPESVDWLKSQSRWRIASIEALLAIDDVQQPRFWDYMDEISGDRTNQYDPPAQTIRGLARAMRSRVDWVDPADFMPTEAIPELGIGETAKGEISLDSVSKSLLQADVLGVDLSEASGMRALLAAVESVNRPTGGPQLGMTGPPNGITLKNGIRIIPLEDGEGGVNQGLSFMVEAGGERFFLKYDYTASAAAEAITPRIVRSFGGPSPRVVPLSVDYGDLETYSLNERQRDTESTLPRLPFLQEMAGQALGERWTTVGQLMSSEQASEDINWQIEEMRGDPSAPASLDFATNLLQSLFANVVAMRWDTHDGNVMVAENEGSDGDTARVKVVPIDNGLSVPWLTMPGRTPAPDNIPQFAGMMVGSRAGALVAEFAQATTTENLTALQDSLSEWADSLREWIKTRALTDIKDGGILAGSKMDKYTKLWLQEAAALSNEEWWDLLIDLDLGDPYAGYGDLFNLINRKESVL